jgi:hypothetical protein
MVGAYKGREELRVKFAVEISGKEDAPKAWA